MVRSLAHLWHSDIQHLCQILRLTFERLRSKFKVKTAYWNSYTSLGPKFTGPFSLNAGGIAIVCNAGRFWISSAIPEIFAIKFWSGPKLTQILHVFGPQIFLGECPPNFWTCIIKCTQFPTMWQSFRAIGRGNSENAWRKKRKKKEKNITSILYVLPYYRNGRPNNRLPVLAAVDGSAMDGECGLLLQHFHHQINVAVFVIFSFTIMSSVWWQKNDDADDAGDDDDDDDDGCVGRQLVRLCCCCRCSVPTTFSPSSTHRPGHGSVSRSGRT